MRDENADLWLAFVVVVSVMIGVMLASVFEDAQIPSCAPDQITTQ